LIAAWSLLGAISFIIGDAAVSLLEQPDRPRRGDRAVLALWLGLILCEWLALTLSLVTAVTPARFFSLVGLIAAAALVRRGGDIARQLKALRRRDLAAAAVITLAAAFVAAGLRPTPDIGEYHYPAIHWLASYGSVPGVAHLLFRLGAASGVFALSAPFDVLLPGRAMGVINGFILCLTAGQVVLTTVRITTGRGRRSDWFLWGGSLGLLAIELVIGSFTTTAPELGVAALTLIISWRMLATDEDPQSAGSLVPLALASGALVAKLSALLLVPIAALFVVTGRGLRTWIGAALLATILVAPMFLASVVASGCLAINVAASCLPVPWVVPADLVNLFSRYTLEWSRWGHYAPANAGPWDWLPVWLSMPLNVVVLPPFALSLIAFLAIAGTRLSRGERWILTLIAPSIVLVLVNSPDPRYNYALFIAPIGLLLGRLGPQALTWPPKSIIAFWSDPIGSAALLAFLLVGSATAIELHHGYAIGADRWLRPRPAPVVAVTQHSEDGLTYFVPGGGPACWRAPLPCTNRELQDLDLLAPERGLAGGFFRSR
jgi:hypothetical protein